MEQLRGLTWGFDTLGLPISDTDDQYDCVARDADRRHGAVAIAERTRCKANTDGYVDYIDAQGNSLGGGTTPPDTRRTSAAG